jgi:hypothetical protein
MFAVVGRGANGFQRMNGKADPSDRIAAAFALIGAMTKGFGERRDGLRAKRCPARPGGTACFYGSRCRFRVGARHDHGEPNCVLRPNDSRAASGARDRGTYRQCGMAGLKGTLGWVESEGQLGVILKVGGFDSPVVAPHPHSSFWKQQLSGTIWYGRWCRLIGRSGWPNRFYL